MAEDPAPAKKQKEVENPVVKQMETEDGELLYTGFNQDVTSFACGTSNGFKIYSCEPFKETFSRNFNQGGIGYVEMLFNSNIIALVGGGKNPMYSPNKVIIWDDKQNKRYGELSFRSEVKAVKLKRDKVIVVLEFKVYIYNLADFKVIDHILTTANPKGLCAVCSGTNNVLVTMGIQKGHVRVELYDMKKYTIIPAHQSTLVGFALNVEGTRLATVSETGTLIRIFDTYTGTCVQEMRRGANPANINSICFDFKTEWLATSSDTGTIHIFSLKDKNNQEQKNPVSALSIIKGVLPKYFGSEWSFAKFRVSDTKTIVSFGPEKNSIIILSNQGNCYKGIFDPTKPNYDIELSVSFKFDGKIENK